MRLRIGNEGLYIRATLEHAARETVLRRWPWPNNPGGRCKHFNEAMEYANRVSAVLACPVEIKEA